MDKQRKRTLTAIVLNSAVIIMVLVYLIMRLVSAGNEILGNSGLGMLKYYTNLSNFLAGIVAVIVLPYEIISFKRGKDILPPLGVIGQIRHHHRPIDHLPGDRLLPRAHQRG